MGDPKNKSSVQSVSARHCSTVQRECWDPGSYSLSSYMMLISDSGSEWVQSLFLSVSLSLELDVLTCETLLKLEFVQKFRSAGCIIFFAQ